VIGIPTKRILEKEKRIKRRPKRHQKPRQTFQVFEKVV
jgi:hypothetical protein